MKKILFCTIISMFCILVLAGCGGNSNSSNSSNSSFTCTRNEIDVNPESDLVKEIMDVELENGNVKTVTTTLEMVTKEKAENDFEIYKDLYGDSVSLDGNLIIIKNVENIFEEMKDMPKDDFIEYYKSSNPKGECK